MDLKIGYLLPTREQIMEGRPEAGPLLRLAEKAEGLGYDSVWVGDSLLARPRHEPLTLLATVAGRTSRVSLGTAVLLPALRNPVVMAHQIATLDQASDGRVILGVGIATDVPNIRAEFEAAGVPFDKRVGRMLEGLRLCRALWSGEPVNWDGRWIVKNGTLSPIPAQSGGPPIWIGGSAPAGLVRAGKNFDGWFPTGPNAESFGAGWQEVQSVAREAGRDTNDLTGAIYLTLVIDDDKTRGDATIARYLENYYGQPAEVLQRRQACFSGSLEEAKAWLKSYTAAGASHLVLRFAGDHDHHLEQIASIKNTL